MDEFHPQTIIGPCRIRSVEPIRFTTMDERASALHQAWYRSSLTCSIQIRMPPAGQDLML